MIGSNPKEKGSLADAKALVTVMTDAEQIFERFPDFIREFIYANSWESLRSIQTSAAKTLFETDHHLLLTSATASGKTEAAFFPILTDLWENPPFSVGALYIAPLKSLINDQFYRMDDLLRESGITVTHWHGDVSMSHKRKLLENPKGILQITPESLEAMLINRPNDLLRLFGDLRYVVIDEVHTLIGSDRGNQIICQLVRLAERIGHTPRRVGLSATVGDPHFAADWLAGGTDRETDVPLPPKEKIHWRLGLEHFYIQNLDENQDPAIRTGETPAASDKVSGELPEKAGQPTDAERTDDIPASAPQSGASGSVSLSVPSEQSGHQAAERPDNQRDEPVPTEEGAEGSSNKPRRAQLDAGYEYMYDCVYGKKALVFSNSREETEYLTATFRQIAKRRGDRDIFLIHHGNLSSALREEAEIRMKDEDSMAVTCATVTMELGIDIGRLERVLQNESPNSVSSFLQRLGRSGRRGEPPEMMMVFREENPLPNTPLPQLIPWELLKAIAIIQLYIEERFIEPPQKKSLPFSLLFHQTLSVLASSGELTAERLAGKILSYPAFSEVTKEEYRYLLVSMLNQEYLEMTEEGGLIVGLRGERILNSFKFYAVFKDSEDFTVRAGSDEIGTITTPPPVGDRFALAGRVWEVEELDIQRKLIYVKQVDGKMEISWPGDYGEIHTRILERMKRVLEEDTVYPYLKENARRRLEVARHLARNTGMLTHSLVHLGGFNWCLFPWLGTRSFRTLRKFIRHVGKPAGVGDVNFEGCYYITFRLEKGTGEDFARYLAGIVSDVGIRLDELVGAGEIPIFDKYDPYIPAELLRHAYVADKLRADEAEEQIIKIFGEFSGN